MRIPSAASFAFTVSALAVALAADPAQAQAQTSHKATKRAAAAAATGLNGAWKSVYKDEKVQVSIDTTQTKREGASFNTRLRWQYASDQPIGRDRSYRTLVERKMIECGSTGVKPISALTYDETGKSVSSYTISDREVKAMDWSRRTAGSSAANAYVAVCAEIRK